MKILAIGKNYINEGEDKNAGKTGNPIIFSKPETSLVTNNQDVEFPDFTNDLRYEAELVIKIGKTGKKISESDAKSFIVAIGIGIDFTAKDIFDQSREGKGPWDLGKGFDGGAPVSSFVPVSEFPDLNNINFDLKINDELKQTGNTALMIYSFEEIIAYVSKFMTLQPGDLIFTGTPAKGTGQIYKGDKLAAAIEGKEMIAFAMS